jgi:hypothetical protein
MQFNLVLNPKPINLNPSQNPIWLAHFDFAVKYFLAYWLRVEIIFNILAQDLKQFLASRIFDLE